MKNELYANRDVIKELEIYNYLNGELIAKIDYVNYSELNLNDCTFKIEAHMIDFDLLNYFYNENKCNLFIKYIVNFIEEKTGAEENLKFVFKCNLLELPLFRHCNEGEPNNHNWTFKDVENLTIEKVKKLV